MTDQHVILVDEEDRTLGSMEKMEAHKTGALHRAFSIFIFNKENEMLLQQRAWSKYHSPGLWSNACCSHPHPGQQLADAAQKRLQEEMGFSVALEKAFEFIYRASLENDLQEYEFDHVFAGRYSGEIQKNPREVNDYTYKPMLEIEQELIQAPQKFTAWFPIAFPRIKMWWHARYP